MPQDQLIRDSFAVVHEMPEAVAMLFYGRLFSVDPSLRALFKTDMRTQSRKLMDTLAALVDSLDHLERMRPALRELGRKHAQEYHVRPEHYQTVRDALLWALGQALQQQFYPEIREAWETVLKEIAQEMLAGSAEVNPPGAY